jgi:hypothetical protein
MKKSASQKLLSKSDKEAIDLAVQNKKLIEENENLKNIINQLNEKISLFKYYIGEKSKQDVSLFTDFNNVVFENIKIKNEKELNKLKEEINNKEKETEQLKKEIVELKSQSNNLISLYNQSYSQIEKLVTIFA